MAILTRETMVDIQTADEALDLIMEAIEKAGYKGKVNIAMDVASSEFYKEEEKKYDLDFKNPDSDKRYVYTGQPIPIRYQVRARRHVSTSKVSLVPATPNITNRFIA